jgi:hypothetical protein
MCHWQPGQRFPAHPATLGLIMIFCVSSAFGTSNRKRHFIRQAPARMPPGEALHERERERPPAETLPAGGALSWDPFFIYRRSIMTMLVMVVARLIAAITVRPSRS